MSDPTTLARRLDGMVKFEPIDEAMRTFRVWCKCGWQQPAGVYNLCDVMQDHISDQHAEPKSDAVDLKSPEQWRFVAEFVAQVRETWPNSMLADMKVDALLGWAIKLERGTADV